MSREIFRLTDLKSDPQALFSILDVLGVLPNVKDIRKLFEDWDFTENGRKRQANRMMTMCDLAVNHVVVDFVCPFESYRSFYDMKIWINTIDKGRFEDTNKIFEKPKKADFEITNFNYDNIIKEIHGLL